MKFEIIFYQTLEGKMPVHDFLCSLDTKHLDNGIFELRCKLGSNLTRTLYFFYTGGRIVFTNGFVKKTPKTPPSVIDLAKKYRADFISRQEE